MLICGNFLILLLVLMMPINYIIYAQSIGDEIGQVFKNLLRGPFGNKTITDPSMDIDLPPVNINSTNYSSQSPIIRR